MLLTSLHSLFPPICKALDYRDPERDKNQLVLAPDRLLPAHVIPTPVPGQLTPTEAVTPQ
jgi:hypothetical protein